MSLLHRNAHVSSEAYQEAGVVDSSKPIRWVLRNSFWSRRSMFRRNRVGHCFIGQVWNKSGPPTKEARDGLELFLQSSETSFHIS